LPDDLNDEAGALSPDTAPDTVFERFLDEGALAFQRCTACAHAVFPPRVLCPACGDPRLEWNRSTGHGVVYSLSTLAPRGEQPYTVALVDVAEGFRLMTTVVADAEVAIGDPVRADFSAGLTPAGPFFVPEASR
jgi:uncharacterized OB-fold protein